MKLTDEASANSGTRPSAQNLLRQAQFGTCRPSRRNPKSSESPAPTGLCEENATLGFGAIAHATALLGQSLTWQGPRGNSQLPESLHWDTTREPETPDIVKQYG